MGTVYLTFFIALTLHGVMGSRPVISPTYIQLIMVNYENSKLTGALGNGP